MFSNLSERLSSVFKRFKGAGQLSNKDVDDGMKHVKMALLEADVNYLVTKELIAGISKRALGQEVMKSLTPAQQIVKIVNEEMSKIMGGEHQGVNFIGSDFMSLMLVGLQGSGKTTTAGKIALYLKNQGKKPYLVSIDVYRPAAISQLKVLAESLNIDFFDSDLSMKPIDICKHARFGALKLGCDALIIDTAGRLHIDKIMMKELIDTKKIVNPSDILLIADSMTGQEAVNIAKNFDSQLDITGIILTKMDGDARGGAALSMNFVTKKPIKFMGVGEKLNDFEPFHPDRVASRILGMGDILTIIDKAQMTLNKESAENIQKRLKDNTFTLEDFKCQMIQFRKMGSFKDLLGMIPGISKMKQMKGLNVDEKEFYRIEAIINSMTPYERKNYTIINGSRRKRIAKGSGTKVQNVNRLLKNYVQVMKIMKKFNNKSMNGFVKGMLPF